MPNVNKIFKLPMSLASRVVIKNKLISENAFYSFANCIEWLIFYNNHELKHCTVKLVRALLGTGRSHFGVSGQRLCWLIVIQMSRLQFKTWPLLCISIFFFVRNNLAHKILCDFEAFFFYYNKLLLNTLYTRMVNTSE